MKRMQQKAEEEKVSSKRDGAKLSFKEKMELFAAQNGDNLREKAKISKAQREIDGEQAMTNRNDDTSSE